MLEALIAGDRDPAALADLAKRRLRSKIPQLTEALNGWFTEHHAFLARVHLDLIDRHTEALHQLTEQIEVMMEPFQGFRDLICSISGISTLTADVIIAETGADTSRFPTAKHLASWAATTPGNNESAGAGQVQPHPAGQPRPPGSRRRRGDGVRAEPAHLPRRPLPAHRDQTGDRRRPTSPSSDQMLTAIWHTGTTGTLYEDPGAEFFTRPCLKDELEEAAALSLA